jgi:hypothetical protein
MAASPVNILTKGFKRGLSFSRARLMDAPLAFVGRDVENFSGAECRVD